MAIQQRVPTGDVSGLWIALGGGASFVEVDDPVGAPDDDTTYISRADSNSIELLSFSAFTVPAGATVARVSVHFRGQRTAAGTLSGVAVIRTGTTGRLGASQAQTESWANYSEHWTTNPATTAAWTPEEVNGTSGTAANNLTAFGLSIALIGAGEEMRVTQVYAEVEYTPAGVSIPIAAYHYRRMRMA